jgi:hypothetical protein
MRRPAFRPAFRPAPRAASRAAAAALGAAALAACSLDLTNPNAPNDTEVTTNPEGVAALATGLQSRFATSYGNFAYMAGLVTDELAAVSAALISISDAEQGAVPSGTGVADFVFNNVYRTVRAADDVLAGVDAVSGQLDPGTRSGLRALALALKAESLGEALQSYQRVPVATYNVAAPAYVTRAEALPVVRALLDTAAAEIAAAPPSAFFNATVLTPGVSLPNVIQLFRARYARMAGDQAAALAAADQVARTGPGAFSALAFPAPGINPYANVTGGINGVLPRRQWRLSLPAGDQRAAYFVTPGTATGRIGTPLDNWARYGNPQGSLPVYLPDEALLIKAEALAAQGQLAAAQAALDSVRTDCPGGRGLDDPKACLPRLAGQLSQEALLAEVYAQRRWELFATGLRWEDARRRGAVRGPAASPAQPLDAQRCWLPYAVGDRNANPNATFAALPDPQEPAAFPSGCPAQ